MAKDKTSLQLKAEIKKTSILSKLWHLVLGLLWGGLASFIIFFLDFWLWHLSGNNLPCKAVNYLKQTGIPLDDGYTSLVVISPAILLISIAVVCIFLFLFKKNKFLVLGFLFGSLFFVLLSVFLASKIIIICFDPTPLDIPAEFLHF